MPKDKKLVIYWSIGVVIVVIVAIIIILASRHRSGSPATTSTNTAPTASSTPAQASATPVTSIKSPKPTSAYTALVSQYKNSRIQFTPTCQAVPNNMTFRNPVTIMLDNRSPQSAKIVFNSRTYNLAAWSYYITTVNVSGLPKNLLVDCNSSNNVAQILMQE